MHTTGKCVVKVRNNYSRRGEERERVSVENTLPKSLFTTVQFTSSLARLPRACTHSPATPHTDSIKNFFLSAFFGVAAAATAAALVSEVGVKFYVTQ
jgi:hypothetical protein